MWNVENVAKGIKVTAEFDGILEKMLKNERTTFDILTEYRRAGIPVKR